jgi:hypothetical protein
LIPSGVASKAQAKNTATIKPSAVSRKIACMTQAGAPIFSSTISATWISNQPPIR